MRSSLFMCAAFGNTPNANQAATGSTEKLKSNENNDQFSGFAEVIRLFKQIKTKMKLVF